MPTAKPIETAPIVDTTADGRGIARADGKTVFVFGALQGERVRFIRRKKRRNYDEAELVEVLEASSLRVEPRCAVFERCGGCSLQHLDSEAQLAIRQGVLLDHLERIGGVAPDRMIEPIAGSPWGYRRKARLAVKYVAAKGRVLIGFRERHAPFITDMQDCETLHPAAASVLAPLADLIGSLELRARIPQIEVAVGDEAVALVFRVLDPPAQPDIERLRAFEQETEQQIWLQTGGPGTIESLPGAGPYAELFYALPRHELRIYFRSTDFIQVHAEVNARMVDQALELLRPGVDQHIVDLFCGLGNFSLPLARRAGRVTALEGSPAMTAGARTNASRAGLANVEFLTADLLTPGALEALELGRVDALLLDPPRTGARDVLPSMAKLRPQRILYVSCHPGTLARDARELVSELGYDLSAAGVMDMFPQTSHVESMALFERR